MINFIVIDTRNPVVPSNTLGIEVTTPSVAAMCDRGNIDPQHGQMRAPFPGALATSPVRDAVAAIDAALDWPLPEGGIENLATERPDLDSIGAMAVLALRLDRVELSSESIKRVARIAAADNFGGGKWAPMPLPTPEQPWPSGAACVADTPSLAHVASICSPMGDQPRHPMAFRVACVATWILEGDERGDSIDLVMGATIRPHLQRGFWPVGPGEAQDAKAIDEALRAARADVDARRIDMARALTDGRIVVDAPNVYEGKFDAVGQRRYWAPVASVHGSHAGALAIGYCVAPVAIATNPEYHWPSGVVTEKVTIAFYEPPGAERMTAIRDALNRAEIVAIAEGVALAWTSAGWDGGPIERAFQALADAVRAGGEADLTLVRAALAEWSVSEPGVDPLAEESHDAIAVIAAGGGWGGNLKSGILGSPQGRKSVLLTEEIVACVRGAL